MLYNKYLFSIPNKTYKSCAHPFPPTFTSTAAVTL